MNAPLREKIFALLENEIAPKVNKRNGRSGMTLWHILVFGVLRLDLNIDYDRLHELSNQHRTLRQMLGHGLYDEDKEYAYQTLVDNVGLLTPELLDKLNQIIVEGRHVLIKKDGAALRGRCDSFVVETDVHFPIDISLLWDAMRKAITLTAQWSENQQLSDWRQYRHNLRQLKRKLRQAQQSKRRASATQAHGQVNQAQYYLNKIQSTLLKLVAATSTERLLSIDIESYLRHARRQINQIERRVIENETIPHEEKVFSIFELHTEWISNPRVGSAWLG